MNAFLKFFSFTLIITSAQTACSDKGKEPIIPKTYSVEATLIPDNMNIRSTAQVYVDGDKARGERQDIGGLTVSITPGRYHLPFKAE